MVTCSVCLISLLRSLGMSLRWAISLILVSGVDCVYSALKEGSLQVEDRFMTSTDNLLWLSTWILPRVGLECCALRATLTQIHFLQWISGICYMHSDMLGRRQCSSGI